MNTTKTIALVLLVTIITSLLTMTVADAQTANSDQLDYDVQIEFGEQITFSVTINSETTPLRAALFLRTSTASPYKAYIATIEGDELDRALIDFKPQSINLLPFNRLSYYWQVDLDDGSVLSMEPVTATYHDTRYAWQEISQGQLTVYWVDGGIDWGQEIYAIAETALSEIERLIAVPGSGSRHIYAYPSQSELQNSLRQAGINQASAHTLPELGVVLVAGQNNPETLIRFEQEVPHELVHVLLYERMGSNINNLPVWLNEGLAAHFEQSPNSISRSTLENAVEQNALIQMESLCSAFPVSETERILAYAQSRSFVEYLLDIYGTGGVNQLLDAYQEGVTCTGAIQRVYQRPLTQLEDEWKQTGLDQRNPVSTAQGFIYPIAGMVVLLGIAILIILRKKRTV